MLCSRRLFISVLGAGDGLPQDAARLGVAELGRAARRALNEGDFNEERWKVFAHRASELAGQMNLDETARLASAFSTARMVDFHLFSQLSARALQCLPQPPTTSKTEMAVPDGSTDAASSSSPVSSRDLRRLALAFGRAQAFDSELMEAMVPLIADRVESFRPRELVHIVDAYARMPVQMPELFALVADALPHYLYDLEPTELAGLCRSFAEAAVYNEELIDALGAEATKRARSFGALECLVFLDGLSRLHAGLPEELRDIRRKSDTATVSALAEQLAGSASVLSAPELVRAFAALVRLDHYDPKLVHGRICAALALKLGQLVQASGTVAFSRPSLGANGFGGLAELLHCISLLPAQSQKSAELALATARLLVETLGEMLRWHSADEAQRGSQLSDPRGKAAASVGRLPDPHSLALAAAAVAQLGQNGREDEELLELLSAAVTGGRRGSTSEPIGSGGLEDSPVGQGASLSPPSTLLWLSSEEELGDLERAFSLCHSPAALPARSALAAEMARRLSSE
ncbi:unnamed protein product [Polarella glacialis]|uniref:RNA-editing substrate-binding complex 6 protein domain-containing protein n=1 Tax=Polarella glacialis TaxID=89957 RepID=A0A813L0S2_POLGL|nr:unnamed protein product [Polarella glacialis]